MAFISVIMKTGKKKVSFSNQSKLEMTYPNQEKELNISQTCLIAA